MFIARRNFNGAGTKLGPDQLGSLDPGRINTDQPGSTRIIPDRLKFEHSKRKGMLNKRKMILLRIYGLTVMKIKQSLLSCAVLPNLVPRVLSLPPSRKYPGFGWSRGTQNLGANKNVLQGRGSKV